MKGMNFYLIFMIVMISFLVRICENVDVFLVVYTITVCFHIPLTNAAVTKGLILGYSAPALNRVFSIMMVVSVGVIALR